MSTQYGNASGGENAEDVGPSGGVEASPAGTPSVAQNAGTDAGPAGASLGARQRSERAGWGSGSNARSDYGSHIYGGSLDQSGHGAGVEDSGRGGREGNGRSSRLSFRHRQRTSTTTGTGSGSSRGGSGWDTGLTLLAGVGIGALLMYLLDPDQGRRRRALLRGQCVALSNDLGEAVSATARDLSNRAYGVFAETTGALGLRSGAQEQEGQQTGEQ